MKKPRSATSLPWRTLFLAWAVTLGILVGLEQLDPSSGQVAAQRVLDYDEGTDYTHYAFDYAAYEKYFTDRGVTIPANVQTRIITNAINPTTGRTDLDSVIAATEAYRKVLTALQTRFPTITTPALSVVAADNFDDVSSAIAAADNVGAMSTQLQSYHEIGTAAAQIAAAHHPGDFSGALATINTALKNVPQMQSITGMSADGAQVLSVLDATGDLGMAASTTGELNSILGGMTGSSGLESTEARDLLAALNVFTPGNFSADESALKNIAREVYDRQLPSDVKDLLSLKDVQNLTGLSLGSLSGLSPTNANFGTLSQQITTATAGKAGEFKQIYDALAGDVGMEKLRDLGLDKAKSMVMDKMNLPKDLSLPSVTDAVKDAVKTPGGTTPGSPAPGGSSSPAPGGSGSPIPGSSATPTPTTSPSPTASGSPSPSPSGSPSPSPSASASPTPTPTPRPEAYIKSPMVGSLITAMTDKFNASGVAGAALDSLKVKTYTKNIVFEGYEAYHIKRVDRLWPYMNYSHRRNDVDFSESKIPLLRNSKYAYERLNSAENYYGYNARPDVNGGKDLLVESGWVTKMSSPVKCMLKTSNLAYIVRTCDIGKDETCEALYLGADGQETIRGTKIKIHDLAVAITAILIADAGEQDEMINALALVLATGKGDIGGFMSRATDAISKIGGESSEIYQRLAAMAANDVMEPIVDGRMPFCETLYNTAATNAVDEKGLAVELATGKLQAEDIGKIYLRWAIEKLDFYLAREYRTAYLVQSTRICPTRSQWFCSKYRPIYKYTTTNVGLGTCFIAEPCNPGWTPDQVRVYPFKVPDLFTNHNFCNTSKLDYPGLLNDVKCETSEHFSYTDMIQEYYDPAVSEKNFLTTAENLKTFRQKVNDKRIDHAKKAAEACTVTSIDPFHAYRQIDDEGDLLCNPGSNRSVFSGDQIDCENCKGNDAKTALVKVINSAVKHGYTYNIDNPNGNSAGTDDIGDALKSTSITTSAVNTRERAMTDVRRFNDFCLCREKLFLFIPYFAYARLDYFVVVPYSDEAEIIEKTVISPYMDQEKYTQFLKADQRQNRKIQVQGQKSKLSNIPIWLPAGGPISNSLIQQESLYSTDTSVYQGFKKCSSVPSYFETRCAEPGDGLEDPEFDDAKSNCILNAEARCVRTCGEAGSNLTYDEADDTMTITCECPPDDELMTRRGFTAECGPSDDYDDL